MQSSVDRQGRIRILLVGNTGQHQCLLVARWPASVRPDGLTSIIMYRRWQDHTSQPAVSWQAAVDRRADSGVRHTYQGMRGSTVSAQRCLSAPGMK